MFGFRREKPGSAEPVKPPCNHKWKDFDWYLTYDIIGRSLKYQIYEPYVCIHCKKRKDISLESGTATTSSYKDALETLNIIKERYPKIKDRAIVEDEINDAQLVDREYLKYASMVMGVKL